MHKVKAFLGGLVQPGASEFWMLWGSAIIGTLTHYFPQVTTALDAFSVSAGYPSGAALVSTLVASGVTYAVGRMTSKAAKSQAPANISKEVTNAPTP